MRFMFYVLCFANVCDNLHLISSHFSQYLSISLFINWIVVAHKLLVHIIICHINCYGIWPPHRMFFSLIYYIFSCSTLMHWYMYKLRFLPQNALIHHMFPNKLIAVVFKSKSHLMCSHQRLSFSIESKQNGLLPFENSIFGKIRAILSDFKEIEIIMMMYWKCGYYWSFCRTVITFESFCLLSTSAMNISFLTHAASMDIIHSPVDALRRYRICL